jgi:hypothetical protein
MNKADLAILQAEQAETIISNAAELFSKFAERETQESFLQRKDLAQPVSAKCFDAILKSMQYAERRAKKRAFILQRLRKR